MRNSSFAAVCQETLSLRFRSCFLNFGTYGLALVNQIFDSDFCLAGVPLQTTFANCESTFSKPRMDKNKTTNPFGQTTKRCLTAAGATFQNYESEFPDYEQRFSDYDWRSSTWNFQTTNGPKILLRTLKTLTTLNKEVRVFFLSDKSIWSFPSVSSLSDYSIWRS